MLVGIIGPRSTYLFTGLPLSRQLYWQYGYLSCYSGHSKKTRQTWRTRNQTKGDTYFGIRICIYVQKVRLQYPKARQDIGQKEITRSLHLYCFHHIQYVSIVLLIQATGSLSLSLHGHTQNNICVLANLQRFETLSAVLGFLGQPESNPL